MQEAEHLDSVAVDVVPEPLQVWRVASLLSVTPKVPCISIWHIHIIRI